MIDVAGEAYGRGETERVGEGLEAGLLGTGAEEGEVGGGEGGTDRHEGLEEQIESFFRSEPADGQQMGTRAGPGLGRFGSGENGLKIDGVGEDGDPIRAEMKLAGEVLGHGGRLADDAVGVGIEEAIEQAGIGGRSAGGERGGESGVLADEDASARRKEGTKQEDEEVEMRHSGEDEIGAETANQAEQRQRGRADTRCAEGMDGDPGGNICGGGGLRDEAEVQVVLFAGQASGQQRGDLLGAAAAQMRDEQKNSETLGHEWMDGNVSI